MWNDIRPGRTQPEEKLEALRSRTDRDLAALLRKAIERGFQELSAGNHGLAESACGEAASLLPLVRTVPARELQTLRSHFDALRAELDKTACLEPLAG